MLIEDGTGSSIGSERDNVDRAEEHVKVLKNSEMFKLILDTLVDIRAHLELMTDEEILESEE